MPQDQNELSSAQSEVLSKLRLAAGRLRAIGRDISGSGAHQPGVLSKRTIDEAAGLEELVNSFHLLLSSAKRQPVDTGWNRPAENEEETEATKTPAVTPAKRTK